MNRLVELVARWRANAAMLAEGNKNEISCEGAGMQRACADELEAALQSSAWQPIETAPKDGTRVLVYACAHKRHWFGTGYYFKGVPGDGEGWVAHSFYTAPENDASGSFEPSHWMPMLSVPEAAGGER